MTRAAVVLAAGQGTRFHSERAKVLHTVAGRSMLRWVLDALRPLALDRVVVVVGHQREQVRAEAEAADPAGLVVVTQPDQHGTGHAVRMAVEQGALEGIDTVLVLPGDVPLLVSEPLRGLLDQAGPGGAAATVLSFEADEPAGYGRIVRDRGGGVARIVEHRDATPAERAITEVNSAIYAFDRAALVTQLARLSADNDQGEEYLTDVIAPLAPEGVRAVAAPPEVVAGVNDRAQLSRVGTLLRARILERLMRGGVTVTDPATTYVDADVEVAADAVLRPGTHLEGATRVGAGAQIGPHSRLVDAVVGEGASVTYSVVLGARIGPDAVVGPFTYLRPGTALARGAKAGAYVEMKNAEIGEDSKVPHLSYIGDTEIGAGVNVGAATVTVNYDGFDKHRTVIADGAKIGSDTMLVAPVRVGVEAYTGAGSVITTDVPDGALAVERTEQRNIEGYAQRRRDRHERDGSGAGE